MNVWDEQFSFFQMFLIGLYFAHIEKEKVDSVCRTRLWKFHCLFFNRKTRTRWSLLRLCKTVISRYRRSFDENKQNPYRVFLAIFSPRPINTSQYTSKKTAAMDRLQSGVGFTRRPHDLHCYSKALRGGYA